MALSRIMLTGVPGVGKTTVSSQPTISDLGIRVQNFGQVMFLIGKQRKLVSDIKDLESLTIEQRAELQTDAAKQIAADNSALGIVIDGHVIVDTSSGFVPGLPIDCVSILNLSSIVMLSSHPSDVVSRRSNHVNKYGMMKQWSDEERVETHQKVVFQVSLQYSLLSQSSFDILENRQGCLVKTAEDFRDFLTRYI